MQHAEIVTINFETSMGSIGGITTIGNEEVVDHQRLSGAGYCFSASLPPSLASAAQASLKRMETHPQILDVLKNNISYFYSALHAALDGNGIGNGNGNGNGIGNGNGNGIGNGINTLTVTSTEGISPLVFLQITKHRDDDNDNNDDSKHLSRKQQIEILDEIAKKCLINGVFVVSTGRHVMHHLHKIPPPALRLVIMAKYIKSNINTAIKLLK